MAIRPIVIACLFATALIGCKTLPNEEHRPTPEPSGREFLLSEDELQKKKTAALLGDSNSAVEVSHYYTVAGKPNGPDWDEWKRWTTIAAENGHPWSQLTIAQSLRADGTSEGKLRARFWLRRAAASNDPSILRELHLEGINPETGSTE